jgi:PAS domain S-box-containing protein
MPEASAASRGGEPAGWQSAVQQAQQLAALFEHAGAGLLRLDEGWRVTNANSRACEILARSRTELSGVSLCDLTAHDDRPGHLAMLDRLGRDRAKTCTFDARCVRGDGTPVWLNVTIGVLHGAGPHGRSALVTLNDITAQKQAEAALVLRAQEAAGASRAKDEFLATVSHELRTPLNVVLGQSRLLRTGPRDGDTVERCSQIIERNAATQIRLVEDLLDVQRITSGRLRMERTSFDMASLVQAVADSFGPTASARNLHWVVDAEPVDVCGDPARIQQVLWNLLSNAIKFTPEGGFVGLRARRNGQAVVITVQDSGEGIPPHLLPYVFERAWQLRSSAAERHGGMGLGLAIVKTVVELHGGTVAVESAGPDRGTTFTVHLPLVGRQDPPRLPARTAGDAHAT